MSNVIDCVDIFQKKQEAREFCLFSYLSSQPVKSDQDTIKNYYKNNKQYLTTLNRLIFFLNSSTGKPYDPLYVEMIHEIMLSFLEVFENEPD